MLFDPILVQIIVVGEQTGNLGEILQTMAEFYKEQLMQKITSAVSLIEPILMGLIAIIIGSIVASVFLPLADLVSVIGQ
ncbi:type II secretion system F family protein [Patescibacteria group bacterium]|nr:type II secretion system F family protein [Patescibacteria group bacterium]